jgi:hypothetical protein
MNALTPAQDLYSDFLVVNQGQASTTRLAALLEQHHSHDYFTRCLHQADYGSTDLWKVVKPFARQMAQPDAVLVLDDTVEAKPHSAVNDLICYHYDHCTGRTVKGINQLTALYHSQDTSLTVGYKLITKTKTIQGKKGPKKVSEHTKNQHFRTLVGQAMTNQLPFAYVLADCWYCCTDNINYLIDKGKQFVFALKSNRQVAISEAAHQQGRHQSRRGSAMSELAWEQNAQHRSLAGRGREHPFADQSGL